MSDLVRKHLMPHDRALASAICEMQQASCMADLLSLAQQSAGSEATGLINKLGPESHASSHQAPSLLDLQCQSG